MKKVFVKTKNVKQLISMMNRLKEREDGVPGMGLVYGEPGLGKTYAITWWAAQNDAILIRSANLMSARWLLEKIVEELGEIPYNKFSDIFNQVVAQLIKTTRTIIVDKTDYLTIDSRAVETLMDIHDKTMSLLFWLVWVRQIKGSNGTSIYMTDYWKLLNLNRSQNKI